MSASFRQKPVSFDISKTILIVLPSAWLKSVLLTPNYAKQSSKRYPILKYATWSHFKQRYQNTMCVLFLFFKTLLTPPLTELSHIWSSKLSCRLTNYLDKDFMQNTNNFQRFDILMHMILNHYRNLLSKMTFAKKIQWKNI